jgi:hypothetical protein
VVCPVEAAGRGGGGAEGEGEEKEGARAPLDPPPFSVYAKLGCSLKDYVKEVVKLLVEERGSATLNEVWIALRRAAEKDKRVAEGLTQRMVLLVLRELKKEGYDVRLRIR